MGLRLCYTKGYTKTTNTFETDASFAIDVFGSGPFS